MTVALQVPGAFLGVGAVLLVGLGISLGVAMPAIINWFEDVTAGIAVLIQKVVGWTALIVIVYAVLHFGLGVV